MDKLQTKIKNPVSPDKAMTIFKLTPKELKSLNKTRLNRLYRKLARKAHPDTGGSKKEFVHFLYIARGSLYETITLLIIFHNNKWIDHAQLNSLKTSGDEIGKMLSSLIRSIKNN